MSEPIAALAGYFPNIPRPPLRELARPELPRARKRYKRYVRVDLTGQRFGLMVALRPCPTGSRYWFFACDCGAETRVRISHVRRGRQSCGCTTRDGLFGRKP